MNFRNIFDTSVSSLFKISNPSVSNRIFIHIFTQSFHDQLIGKGVVVVASSLSDRCLVIIFITSHLSKYGFNKINRLIGLSTGNTTDVPRRQYLSKSITDNRYL